MRLRTPFVLRVRDQDPESAAALAKALVAPLAARGGRVILDDVPQTRGGAFAVHVITDARERRGTFVSVGVSDAEGARWLAPIEVPDAPHDGAARVIRFLEEWGFLPSPPPAASAPRATPP